jgi:4-amino-4-deoxy-L-arabinose transferase-like glycosyltransferase
MPATIKLKRHLLSVAILLVAFALRIAAIDQIPPGLSHDEAYNGVTAIQVLEGQHRIFFEINKGIEPLIIYLEALAFYAFGIGPVQLRLVNIFCGMLTVALVYPLAVQLFNRRVALLAMAGLGISFWAVFVSRLTLRAVTFPPLLILTLYFLWRGLTGNKSTLTFFMLSGLAAGASMYTYLSSRFVPLLVIAIFGHQLLRRQIKRQHWLGLLIHFVILTAMFAPLANYFWQNADSFTERSSQVTTIPYVLNGEFGPMLRNTLRTLGMFTFHGDETDRYNLDGRPVFDWVNGLLFYLGLGIILLRLPRPPRLAGPAALLLLWLFFMLLPDFITDDSPHFLRTIGAMPAVYIIWAVGLDWSIERMGSWVKQRESQQPTVSSTRARVVVTSFLVVLLLLTTVHTIYDYFGRWAAAPDARYIYGADIAAIVRYLKGSNDNGLTAISAEYYRDLDPFRFSLHFQGHPPFVIWFDGRQSLAFPPSESSFTPRYIFAASAPAAETWLPLLQTSEPESGREYTLYRLPSEADLQQLQLDLFPPENRLGLNINNDFILSGYQVLGSVVSGGKFSVLLGWQALRPLPPGTDYTFVARLWDNQGHLWVETDGLGYSPSDWQPGVQAMQLLTFRLPGDLPARTYNLTLEVVDRHAGKPLPATAGETVIPLATLPGHLADKPRTLNLERLPNPIANLPSAIAARSDRPQLALRGYQIHDSTLQPGDTLQLTLHWQVLEQPQQNYKYQFLLTNEQAEPSIMYSWDPIEPVGREWPTSQWPTNYWVQDKIDLAIDPDIPAGRFNLWVVPVTSDTAQSSLAHPNELKSSGYKLDSVAVND